MRYFPLFLDLRGRPTLVVGGGPVAGRKAELLASAGARVTLVAPQLAKALAAAVAAGRFAHRCGQFDPADVAGQAVVIAATAERAVNAQVAAAARAQGIPVNVVDDPELSTFIVPSIIDRAPVQIAVSTGGASPVLARLLRERLESLLDESLGRLAEFAARWRARLKRVLPQVSERRGFLRWMLEGPAAIHVRSGRLDAADSVVEQALARHSARALGSVPDSRMGSVTLVGAGPGDPGLLTLRALRALQEADVILHDRLVTRAVLALARRDATLENVAKVVGGGGASQDAINRRMVVLARQGQRVVRLKGGDPFVFGRGGEEIEYLRSHGVAYEIVPGVTAALGCAAHAGIALTDRRYARAVTLATAHTEGALDEIDWRGVAGEDRTLVLYMGVGTLPEAVRRLLAAGVAADLPAALVENGTCAEQRVVVASVGTLADAASRAALRAPALVIIGRVAAAAGANHWFGAPPSMPREIAGAAPAAGRSCVAAAQ